MELVSQIITIGILATTGMTFFSYAISYFSKSKFEEPQLINTLLDRIPNKNQPVCQEHIIGWLLHILIGIFFVTLFKIGLLYTVLTLSLVSGMVFGFSAGLLGVLSWHLAFTFHPDPPNIDKITFYIQLVVAHIIFGVCCVLLFKL
ncbi:hypothetical protein [Rasiella sp. SM2506]|uniref:hypothetical protein n=1 Tax=Rasiella sp. SM2506 TaxID=3423914 RepID=UPI003D79CF67